MPVQASALLSTKLHRPRVTGNLVPRPRLVEQLNRGLSGPLTLVCAPAGFGKTTLVSSWIEAGMAAGAGGVTPPLPAAWLSLDENDSDPTLFLRYFIAAVRTAFPEACSIILDLLRAPRQAPSEVILTALINELALLPGRFVFVLDDYHSIGGEVVPGLLNGLIRHWPAPLHLVLISRSNPALPLTNLRAKGQVVEIRGRDLRFTLDEAAAFLGAALPAPPSESTVALLEQRTEGWITGLQLAALSLIRADDAESAVMALAGGDVAIADFLVDEVLSRQPPAIQKFLLITSILDRFCAALCEALAGSCEPQCNVRACLDWLERANLFVVPLDSNREWYRYHHLFQGLLQRRLLAEVNPDEVAELHCRAATWFSGQHLVDEAVQHALAAGDLDLAARLMERGLQDVLNREDRPTLERWLSLLPEEFVGSRPGTLLIKAWVLQWSWQLDAQAAVLQRVEALIAEEGAAALGADELRIVRGQLLTFHAQAAFFRNEMARAVTFCREALSLLPLGWMYVRGSAMIYLGLGMQAGGQGPAAERWLLDAYESLSDKTTTYALRLLLTLCFVYLQGGQIDRVRQTAELMLPPAIQGRLMILRYWAHYFLGVVHYHRNELVAAQQHFDAVVRNRFATQMMTSRASFFGLVMTQQALGEHVQAWQTLALLSEFDIQARGAEEERTRSLRGRLLLLQGDLEDAARWVDTFTAPPPDRPLLWLEESHLTKVRILLARGQDGDIASVHPILDALGEIAERTFNVRFQIEILALRSLALDLQRMPDEALDALRQAVELSRPGGFIRVFVDLGPAMQAMLLRLAEQGIAVETVRRILGAFPAPRRKIENGAVGSTIHAANARLIEPLTGRELDVLALLSERLSNKEIGRRLGLSPMTVKRHTANLYGKLGVNKRWDAVIKAEALGILPPR